mgnify:FL=1
MPRPPSTHVLPMTAFVPAAAEATSATIRPWRDDEVDRRGHDPRSAYVERFWLGVIGPTATWIMRRFADEFDHRPEGYILDLQHTATSMGLSFARGDQSPFGKALHRCVMFGLARRSADGFDVRRRFPTVAQRHLKRLPDDIRISHDDWARRVIHVDRSQLAARLAEVGLTPPAAARAAEAAALAS